jgi:hypothetical protein
VRDGAHTHGHGHPPAGPGTAVLALAGAALAASILQQVLTLVLIGAAVAAGLAMLGLACHLAAACRRYQQDTARLDAAAYLSLAQADAPRAVAADPVALRQALADLLIPLLAERAGSPVSQGSHQHLHLHGLTPGQAAAMLAELQARHDAGRGQDGGGQ